MELPRINRLSGTTPDDLLKDYVKAIDAASEAIDALGGVWPNGRDYQGGNISRAMHEHAERCRSLRNVLAELTTIAESISNQMGDI
jgi:hypothetical protein